MSPAARLRRYRAAGGKDDRGDAYLLSYPNIVTACENSSMFGPAPCAGLIEPLSESSRLDFRCSWNNPFGEGSFFS